MVTTTILKSHPDKEKLLEKAENMQRKLELFADENNGIFKGLTYKTRIDYAARILGYMQVSPYGKNGYHEPKNCLVMAVTSNPLERIFISLEAE